MIRVGKPRARIGRRVRPALLLAAGLLLLCLAALPAAGQDHEDSFRLGIQAFDRGDWARAALLFEEAVRREPEAGGRVRIHSGRTEPYQPYYWLARAKIEQGDCQGAVRLWDERWEAGIRQRPPLHLLREMRGRLEDCRRRLENPRRGRVEKSPSSVPIDPEAADPSNFREKEPAERNGSGQDTAEQEGAEQEGAGDERQADGPVVVPPEMEEPPPVVTPEDDPRRDRPTVEDPDVTDEEARMEEPPTEGSAAAEAAKVGEAAELYFQGDYERVTTLLVNITGVTPRAEAALLLLRSAANYALYREGGEVDEVLLLRAKKDAERCRALGVDVEPGSSFSPEFRKLFAGG